MTDDLRLIPLFKNLTDSQRALASDRLTEVHAELGAVIARQGDFAYHLFVVMEGTAAVTIDDEVVTSLGPGSSFGEIGLLEHGRRTANVVAATPMRLLTMSSEDFEAVSAEAPEFAAHARTIAQFRLKRT